MKRPLRPEETRLWGAVAATVRLAPGRVAPAPEPALEPPPHEETSAVVKSPRPRRSAPHAGPAPSTPEAIEPNRRRRIARRPEGVQASLDLHGLDQDRARAALTDFLRRAHADDIRAVLVITGKGVSGGGVLKRRAPEWLSDPEVRGLIAGVSPAERHHGGEGALYIALKRRAR